MSDIQTRSEPTETEKARRHKAEITASLAYLIDSMEDARKDGFTVEFQIGQETPGTSPYLVGRLELIKKW